MNSKLWAWIIIAGLSASTLAENARVAPNPKQVQKQEDIKRLMELTGSGNLGIQVMERMVNSFKTSMPKVPATFWDDFMKRVDAKALVELCIPAYERHLSHDDIKKMILFYETPAGKRVVKALPTITQETMIAGQKWGQEIARQALLELKKAGHQ